jgi:hypothetical protein
MLQTSMEALQLEIGCVGCPLQKPFHPMGPLMTHCWLKSFWEVVDRYHLTLELDYKDIPIPRENNATITSIAIGHGFGGDDLLSITRCRLLCSAFSYQILLLQMADIWIQHEVTLVLITVLLLDIHFLASNHQTTIGWYGIDCGLSTAMQMVHFLGPLANGFITHIACGSGFIILLRM